MARPPEYRLPRRGSATDTEVQDRALKEMRKRHEQEFRDTPEKDWPKLYEKHRLERAVELEEEEDRSPLHDNPRSPN